MAENGELMDVNPTRNTKIWATLAGIAIEAPILGLMGFSFLSSLILLVVTSPLLLIFSPLLIGAAAVFGVAMAGFGVAGITAGLGLSSFVLVYRSLIKGRKMFGEYGGADDAPVTVDKMIQSAAEEEQQHDSEVAAGTGDRTEAVKQQQQQGSTSSEPVTVDRMVELFESLKEHPHDQNETPTVVHIVTVEVDDDEEEHQHNKDMASSGGYLQQNVQRQIPQAT